MSEGPPSDDTTLEQLLAYAQALDTKKAQHTYRVFWDSVEKCYRYEILRVERVGYGRLKGSDTDKAPILYAVRRMLGRRLQARERELLRMKEELAELKEQVRGKEIDIECHKDGGWPKELLSAIWKEVRKAT